MTDKPYKKYHANRIRRPHAATDGLAQKLDDEPRDARGQGRPDPAPARPGRSAGRIAGRAPVARQRSDAQAAGAGLASEPRPRRLRWWYVPLIVLVPLVAAGIVAGVWAYHGYRQFDREVRRSNRQIDRSTRAALAPDAGSILGHPTTILLLGTDARGNEPSRTDSIMLLRFNPKTHTVAQLSIPRDTLTPVSGHGETKINEAYFWGGAPLAIQTIREFTGVPVNHVMVVRFRGFRSLINSVGGVTVNVPETVTSTYIGGRTVTFKKGVQHMDGDQALIYSRIRHSDDDFHRMARQQDVVKALEKKIARPDNLMHLPAIGARFMRGVRTDITTNELLTLAYLQWRTKPSHVHKYVLSGLPEMINGGSYVVVDPAEKQRTVAQFLRW